MVALLLEELWCLRVFSTGGGGVGGHWSTQAGMARALRPLGGPCDDLKKKRQPNQNVAKHAADDGQHVCRYHKHFTASTGAC